MRPSTSKRFAQAAGKCTDRLRPKCYTLTRRLPPVLVGVRFLSAVALATDGKLLMALDCDGGQPEFRQLEPARQVAAATGSVTGRATGQHPTRGCQFNQDERRFKKSRGETISMPL